MLGWKTYLLWPEDTKLCMCCTGGHICCGLKTQDFACAGLEDIFVVNIVHTCIHMLTGTRNKDVLKPQLRVKKHALRNTHWRYCGVQEHLSMVVTMAANGSLFIYNFLIYGVI